MSASGQNSRPVVEPSADLRQFASLLRQMHVALTNEGFTEREAVALLGEVLAANIRGQQ